MREELGVALEVLEPVEVGSGFECASDGWVFEVLAKVPGKLRRERPGVREVPVHELACGVAATTGHGDEVETWGAPGPIGHYGFGELRCVDFFIGMSSIVELHDASHGGVVGTAGELNHWFDGLSALTLWSWKRNGTVARRVWLRDVRLMSTFDTPVGLVAVRILFGAGQDTSGSGTLKETILWEALTEAIDVELIGDRSAPGFQASEERVLGVADTREQHGDRIGLVEGCSTICDRILEFWLAPLAPDFEQSVEGVERSQGAMEAVGLGEAAPHD